MKRIFKIAIVAGALVVILLAIGFFFRPKTHRVVTPSGRAYDLIVDLLANDGQYYIKYLSPSSEPEDLAQGVEDLVALVSSDFRSDRLRSLTIEASVPYGLGPFKVHVGYGYVFENHEGKWMRREATAGQ